MIRAFIKRAFFMSGAGEKDFAWEKGAVLDERNSKSVKEVQSAGTPKLVKALHADPILRKEERDKIIRTDQSKPYRELSRTKQKRDETVIIEESQSGLSPHIEDTQAKKLIEPGKKFKGVDRFGKKKI